MPENTVDLHSIMPTPWIKDDHIYGVCSYGELRCLELMTGKRVWETHAATIRQVGPLGERVSHAARGNRPGIPVQRTRRADHRPADAEGLRGDRPGEDPGADEQVRRGPDGGLVAPGVRQREHVCAERQGDRGGFAEEMSRHRRTAYPNLSYGTNC